MATQPQNPTPEGAVEATGLSQNVSFVSFLS
jgi:hypothetical protein